MVPQASSDLFKVEQAPRDPVIGMQEKFNESKSAQKVNLGVGEYKDEKGLPYSLDSVKKVWITIVYIYFLFKIKKSHYKRFQIF